MLHNDGAALLVVCDNDDGGDVLTTVPQVFGKLIGGHHLVVDRGTALPEASWSVFDQVAATKRTVIMQRKAPVSSAFDRVFTCTTTAHRAVLIAEPPRRRRRRDRRLRRCSTEGSGLGASWTCFVKLRVQTPMDTHPSFSSFGFLRLVKLQADKQGRCHHCALVDGRRQQ